MRPIIHLLLRKLSRLIINIDVLFLIGILASMLLLLFGKIALVKVILWIMIILTLLIVVFPLGYCVTVFLENRFPSLKQIPDDIVGVIVLGTGFDFTVSAARNRVSYILSIGRLLAFIEIAKQYPNLRLVFTGAGEFKGYRKESELAKDLFTHAGLDINRIEFEENAHDTNENAKLSFDMIKPAPNEKWLLVTSAAHMPRSVGLFRKLKWNVIPYPVDYHTTGKLKYINVSLLWALYTWRFGIHELCEMVINYLMGESDQVIPR